MEEFGRMKNQSVGAKILLFSEIIIAARALLFFIPVTINKFLSKSFLWGDLEDRFIVVCVLTAVLYFVFGIASLMGFKFWKAIHYVAVALIFAMTISLLNIFSQAGSHYSVPLLCSVIIAVLVGIQKEARPAA